MLDEIAQVQAGADLLHTACEVEAALDAMAAAINAKLAGSNPLALCVINGGIITAGQLLPRLSMPLMLDSINISRYQNQTSGGDIAWLYTPSTPLAGRTVLIIDDVLDEGITLAAIHRYCQAQGAAAVHSAVLVDKLSAKPKPMAADFVGLVVPDRYLFGYGMDYKGYLRNAAGIYACPEPYPQPGARP